VCTWIGAQAQIDTRQTGGRNPLVDAALDISLSWGGAGGDDDELDEMRGRRTGYVASAEQARQRIREARGGRPEADTIRVGEDGAVAGVAVGAAEPADEAAAEVAAGAADGSFEAFMRMFGGGGTPPPAPPPGGS